MDIPDQINHSAHAWLSLYTDAWLLVHHLGLELAVFDVIAWIIELIHRKGRDLWADWIKQAGGKVGSSPGTVRALCQIHICLKVLMFY